ncbi:location of vulva defective 1, partial [Plakobranchus ocellatus]
RQYDDTGDYVISVYLSNSFFQKNFTHLVKVLEKLEGARIESDFPKAPLNLPFTFYFVLYRGDRLDRTTLTWDLGDGSAPFTTERQGQGMDGRDPMTVTYTTAGSKTVMVRADAPMSQSLTASATFDIIQGVDPAAVVVTASAAVQLGQATSFTVTFTSNPLPDAATISVDVDSDGTVDVTAAVSSPTNAGDSETVTYTYTTDGVHNAIVTIYNDASSVSVPVTAGVYQSFSGLSALLTFEQNNPPSRPFDQPGLELSGLKFPLDQPVKFYVTDSNNAYASLYTVTSTSGPDNILKTSGTNNFEQSFTVVITSASLHN